MREGKRRKEAQSKQAGAEAPTNRKKQKASGLRHQCGIVKAIPAKLLTTAVTERLVFALQIAMTARADRESREGRIVGGMLPVVNNLPGKTEREFFACSRETQQFVGCPVEPIAELFQGIDCRGSFAASDISEVSGAEIAEFSGGFVGKITTVTDAENGGRKFLGKHAESSPSV